MSEPINLTPEQIAAMRKAKMAKFRNMGLPAQAGQMTQITEMPLTHQQQQQQQQQETQVQQEVYQPQGQGNATIAQDNLSEIQGQIQQQAAEQRAKQQQYGAHYTQSKHQKIMDIKNGAARDEFKIYNHASTNSGVGGYQLPEPKVGRKQNVPGAPLSKNAVAPTGGPTKTNHDASMIESMFLGTSSPKFSTSSNLNGSLINEEASYGADFNAKWNVKKSQMGLSTPQMGGAPAPNNEIHEMKEMMKMLLENQMVGAKQVQTQPKAQYDIKQLKTMMVEIAKKVSTLMIKEILTEYTKSQKKNVAKPRGENLMEVNGKIYRAVN